RTPARPGTASAPPRPGTRSPRGSQGRGRSSPTASSPGRPRRRAWPGALARSVAGERIRELLLERRPYLRQRDAVLRPPGPRDRGLDRGQVQVEHLVERGLRVTVA